MQDTMCTAILKGQTKSTKQTGQFYWWDLFCTKKSSPRSVILRLPACGVNVFRAQLIKLNHKFSMQFVQVQLYYDSSHRLSSPLLKPERYKPAVWFLQKLHHIFVKMFKWHSGFHQVFSQNRDKILICRWRWNYMEGLWKL
jgi:hypothetical protein